MEELRREFETFKINATCEIENLKRNQNQVFTHLNLGQRETTTTAPPSSPPSSTSPLPSTSPSDSSRTFKNSDVPPVKKRRKTISKKYDGDEQKMLLYGGSKIHVQVDSDH